MIWNIYDRKKGVWNVKTLFFTAVVADVNLTVSTSSSVFFPSGESLFHFFVSSKHRKVKWSEMQTIIHCIDRSQIKSLFNIYTMFLLQNCRIWSLVEKYDICINLPSTVADTVLLTTNNCLVISTLLNI